MDLVGYVLMPIQKNGRSYLFDIPMGAPFEEALEVVAELQKNVLQLQEEDLKRKEALAAKEAPAEVDPIEPEIVVPAQ